MKDRNGGFMNFDEAVASLNNKRSFKLPFWPENTVVKGRLINGTMVPFLCIDNDEKIWYETMCELFNENYELC